MGAEGGQQGGGERGERERTDRGGRSVELGVGLGEG